MAASYDHLVHLDELAVRLLVPEEESIPVVTIEDQLVRDRVHLDRLDTGDVVLGEHGEPVHELLTVPEIKVSEGHFPVLPAKDRVTV